jgi:hypothetical protein
MKKICYRIISFYVYVIFKLKNYAKRFSYKTLWVCKQGLKCCVKVYMYDCNDVALLWKLRTNIDHHK